MARSFKFSVISFEPNSIRRERLNIGIAVFTENGIDVHLTARLEKLRVISSGVDAKVIDSACESLRSLNTYLLKCGIADPAARIEHFRRVGPFVCGDLGGFTTDNTHSYSAMVSMLLRKFVETEHVPQKIKSLKRSRVGQQLKNKLKREFILARPSEGLESHRIVPNYQIADGLVADLVLKNGAFHVIETIDASNDADVLRRAITDVALSALVFERARMAYGAGMTRAKMVYSASVALENHLRPSLDAAEHQGAELVNWESKDDQEKFLKQLVDLAVPLRVSDEKSGYVNGGRNIFH